MAISIRIRNFATKLRKTAQRAMEKLILFLIVFGIGSFYEYLKQKREKRADSAVSPNPAPLRRPKPVKTRPETIKPKPLSAPPVPDKAKAAKKAVSSPKPKPGEILPEEGGSIFDMPQNRAESESSIFAPPKRDKELQQHYERWRRAIIDSEIIQRKF